MTKKLCTILNERAPLFIRVNPKMTTRFDLIGKLRNEYKTNCKPVISTKYGIHIEDTKLNLYDNKYFNKGYFEIQDENSQLVAEYISLFLGQDARFLDYCAGAGGKSLAIAHRIRGNVKIHLHDVRTKILVKCKERLKRNNVVN